MKILDYGKLNALAEKSERNFREAAPYPHTQIDDFLEPEAIGALYREYAEADEWLSYNHYNEKKSGLTRLEAMGPDTQNIIRELSSPEFLAFLEKLTGIDGLIADPDLDGGGLHRILPGGYLNVHADFQSHTNRRNWSRQINLLLYLNRDWQDEWEGFLELWEPDMSAATVRIRPDYNKCVLFHTTADSLHGHPTPLKCPPSESRKSLALYYFRDEGKTLKLQPTNYMSRPEDTPVKRLLIRLDKSLVWAYSALKRYTPLGDSVMSRVLKRFSR